MSHFGVVKNWRAVFDISLEDLFVFFTHSNVTHEVFITVRECVTHSSVTHEVFITVRECVTQK